MKNIYCYVKKMGFGVAMVFCGIMLTAYNFKTYLINPLTMREDCAWMKDSVATYVLDTIDSQKEGDMVAELQKESTLPVSPAVGFRRLNIDIIRDGTSYDLDTACLYLYKIIAPITPSKYVGIQSIDLFFKKFKIPQGSFYFIYNEKLSQIERATFSDNRLDLSRNEKALKGNNIMIEYYEPKGAVEKAKINIKEIVVSF